MVAITEVVVELYPYLWERCSKGYSGAKEGNCSRMCLPRPRWSCRGVLLHVHVSLFTIAHLVVVWRVHHGSDAFVECCSHSTARKQLGILVGVSVVVYGFVLATYSAGVPLLFLYEAKKSDHIVVAYKPAWN